MNERQALIFSSFRNPFQTKQIFFLHKLHVLALTQLLIPIKNNIFALKNINHIDQQQNHVYNKGLHGTCYCMTHGI